MHHNDGGDDGGGDDPPPPWWWYYGHKWREYWAIAVVWPNFGGPSLPGPSFVAPEFIKGCVKCLRNHTEVDAMIKDLEIGVIKWTITDEDIPGPVKGLTGQFCPQGQDGKPGYSGFMKFDASDLGVEGASVVIHELGHAWNRLQHMEDDDMTCKKSHELEDAAESDLHSWSKDVAGNLQTAGHDCKTKCNL